MEHFSLLPATSEQQDSEKPIGVRLIGRVDPRAMTAADFSRSPELLYHGSEGAFAIDQLLDYGDPEAIRGRLGEGSMTLGTGFYAIADRSEAENYSVVRGGEDNAQHPHVIALLPYRARMLDLRVEADPARDAAVPKEIFDSWIALVRAECLRLRRILEGRMGSQHRILSMYERYLQRLAWIEARGKTYDLRTVLATGDSEEAQRDGIPRDLFFTPPWAPLWSRFMLAHGIDGIISHEGGEGQGRGGLSHVFYNLSTIGSYASWHGQRGHGPF